MTAKEERRAGGYVIIRGDDWSFSIEPFQEYFGPALSRFETKLEAVQVFEIEMRYEKQLLTKAIKKCSDMRRREEKRATLFRREA